MESSLGAALDVPGMRFFLAGYLFAAAGMICVVSLHRAAQCLGERVPVVVPAAAAAAVEKINRDKRKRKNKNECGSGAEFEARLVSILARERAAAGAAGAPTELSSSIKKKKRDPPLHFYVRDFSEVFGDVDEDKSAESEIAAKIEGLIEIFDAAGFAAPTYYVGKTTVAGFSTRFNWHRRATPMNKSAVMIVLRQFRDDATETGECAALRMEKSIVERHGTRWGLANKVGGGGGRESKRKSDGILYFVARV